MLRTLRHAAAGISAAVLSLVTISAPANAYDVSTYGYNNQRTGNNADETILGTGTVGGLHFKWVLPLSSVTICSPAVATDVLVNGTPIDLLYTGTEHGDFYAVQTGTGQVVWQRNIGSVTTGCHDMPDQTFGASASPVIDRTANRVYAAGGDGKIYALDLATGAIQPGWPVQVTRDPEHEHVYGALTLSGTTLYVTLASYCDITPYHGRAMAIDVTAQAATAVFLPAGRVNGGGIWGPGGASVDAGGDVYVATGNALTDPESFRYSENVLRLDAALHVKAANYPGLTGADVDFGCTPLLIDPPCGERLLIAENKTGDLLLYNRDDIASGPKQRIKVSGLGLNGDAVYSPAANMVYVSNQTDSGPYSHGLLAFQVQPDCSLRLAWQRSVGINRTSVPPATVANGVVYFASGAGRTLYAFDAVTGAPLWWSGIVIRGEIYEAPVVANGLVFVGAWDGRLYCFGL
jgi:outer membrane protein assembly factor BamB